MDFTQCQFGLRPAQHYYEEPKHVGRRVVSLVHSPLTLERVRTWSFISSFFNVVQYLSAGRALFPLSCKPRPASSGSGRPAWFLKGLPVRGGQGLLSVVSAGLFP